MTQPPAPPVVADPSGDGGDGRPADLGEFIKKQREQAKLSLRNLSKLAGVSNPYLSQIERGLRNPSAEILQAIAKALDLSAETLYVRAGILDPHADGDVESAIARDQYLTEHQRATLIEMYRTFRAVSGLEPQAAEESSEHQPEEGSRRHGMVDRVLDAISTGDVSDEDVAATAAPAEDPEEA